MISTSNSSQRDALMTPVIPTMPTFWLNDVFGRPPNTPATAVPRPSAYVAPAISLSVASRPAPALVVADASPTVSIAETIETNVTAITAPRLNSKPYGRWLDRCDPSGFCRRRRSSPCPARTPVRNPPAGRSGLPPSRQDPFGEELHHQGHNDHNGQGDRPVLQRAEAFRFHLERRRATRCVFHRNRDEVQTNRQR